MEKAQPTMDVPEPDLHDRLQPATPPPYSGPSTTTMTTVVDVHDASSASASASKVPARYPGLPRLDYKLYSPPLFKLSSDSTTLSSKAEYLSTNAAALASLIRAQSTVPPKPQIQVRGTRGRRVDFDIKLNLMSLLVPDDDRSRIDYVRCVGDGEVAYRGAARPDVLPEVGDGGLDEWCRRFVQDTASVKSFALDRVVANLDVAWIEGHLRSLVAALKYRGAVDVTFLVTHSRVLVHSPDRVNQFFTTVASLFSGRNKYEVVKAVWPFATTKNGEPGRRCIVQSEEVWWREWRDPIRYAISQKRQGWVTVEDKLEAVMEEFTRKAAGTLAHDLLKYYHGNETGEIPGVLGYQPPAGDHWWFEGAVMWATLIDYAYVTGDKTYDDLITQGVVWQTGEGQNFMPSNYTVSMGNDDQGLWAMAAMLAAERGFPEPPSDKSQWLTLAANAFDVMAPRYDATCGGGLRWQILSSNNGYDYKNSFSNGVFFNLGARLARYTGNKTYAEWADRTWDWMEKVNLIDPETLAVYDGVNVNGGCKSVNKVQFSGPSGVFALGAAYMYNYTDGASKWQSRLDKLVEQGLKTFFPDGVATETACENLGKCTSDMKMWKGVVLQWYATATQLAPFTAARLIPAIKTSAKLAVQQCTGGDGGRECGFSWANGTFDGDTGAEQEISVLAAVSSLLVQKSDAPRTSKSGGGSSDSNDNVGGDDSGKGQNNPSGKNSTSGADKSRSSAAAVARADMPLVTVSAIFIAAWLYRRLP